MTSLLVQDFLLTHGAGDLRAYHGVKVRWSTKRPGVFTANYDQIEVRDDDPLSQDCRGLILRAARQVADDEPIGSTSIVARPFSRFFNLGQGPCAAVDFDDARFYEKLDGTLCIVHHDAGEWHVGTRGVPDADVPIDGSSLTFRGLFDAAFARANGGDNDLGEWLHEWTEHTLLCELTAPENQVVVAYHEPRITLLGIRHTASGQEVDPSHLDHVFDVCPSHPLTRDTLIEWVSQRDPSQHEGVVVCDSAFRRCKVKSPGYLALSKVRDSVGKSPRAMLELILAGKDDDAKPLLPAYLHAQIDAMKAGVAAELARIDASYTALWSPDRKTFALAIQSSAHPSDMGAHMQRWAGKSDSAASWVASMRKGGTWSDTFLDALLARIAPPVAVSQAA
jgi:hypothetical protein